MEILTRIVRGRTQKQVARELGIAVGTVARHCHDLCDRLGAHNMTEAACLAVSLGLAPPREVVGIPSQPSRFT